MSAGHVHNTLTLLSAGHVHKTLTVSNIHRLCLFSGVPSRCHLQPDSGTCRAHTPQWFYNVTSQQCQVFVYGLCGGNDNRFHTPEDCYSQCEALLSLIHI